MKHVLAQQLNIDGYTIEGPAQTGGMINLSSATIGDIVYQSLGLVFAAAGIGLLLMIIASGFALMTSAGDAKKLAAGQTRLTNSIIGFLIIFGAFWIVRIVGVMFGWNDTILQYFQ